MKIMEQYITNDGNDLRIYGNTILEWAGYSIHGAFVNTNVESIQFHLRSKRFDKLDRYVVFARYSLMRAV